MANRCLLHQKKLDLFQRWLIAEGWELHQPKDSFEVLRAKKADRWLIVFRRLDADVHYSVQDKDVQLIRRFLKSVKNGGPYAKL